MTKTKRTDAEVTIPKAIADRLLKTARGRLRSLHQLREAFNSANARFNGLQPWEVRALAETQEEIELIEADLDVLERHERR